MTSLLLSILFAFGNVLSHAVGFSGLESGVQSNELSVEHELLQKVTFKNRLESTFI